MGNVLVVIDMQNDFITGSLGSKEAEAIVSRVKDKIEGFSGNLIFTRDTHTKEYLNTQEGKNLPVEHCRKDSKGWEIESSLQPYANKPNTIILDKESFGTLNLAKALEAIQSVSKEPIEEIELVGLCTDICVISNAIIIKAAFPEIPVIVDSTCCAGVTKQSHYNALEAMKMCQIIIKG